MTSSERLQRLVDLALPKPSEFGEENFAGDPLVRAFCDMLRECHGLDFHVFITWQCPPNVMVLRSSAGSAVIRSERFDTLLVEYYHQRRLNYLWGEGLARDVATAGILRWMCEMLIGYRQPEIAVLAHTRRPDITGLHLTNPFRDETLASIPELERAAVQCYCLAHEVGHLLIPRQKNVTLDTLVDGIPLGRHVRTQEQQEGVPDEQLQAFADLRNRELDAAHLLNEVEADLFAFSNVVDFLCNVLDYPLEAAIGAALLSFECQSFLYACKGTCHLLSLAAAGELSKRDFVVRDYLAGAEIATRARVAVRRAGLVWAIAEHPTAPAGGRDYNTYVDKVDAMILPRARFTLLMSEILTEQAHGLFATLEENAGPGREAWLDSLLTLVEQDPQLRLDIFYILIAFGCSGAVDVVSYLRGMRTTDEAHIISKPPSQG